MSVRTISMIIFLQSTKDKKMGLFDKLLGGNNDSSDSRHGLIDSGRNKNTGGHDHRTNTGDNRTPSQKEADKARRKD